MAASSEFKSSTVAAAAADHLILPAGFRFHPTDEELVTHYLYPKMINADFSTEIIGEVDLNKVEPWDLPWKGKMGEKEWYFFCKKDRKYPTGMRTNRATESGYWKATGKDKEIYRGKILIGMKKTLVFYKGRAPKGQKTNWVMHEFRSQGNNSSVLSKNEWVISRVFKKSSGGKKVHISDLVRSLDSGTAVVCRSSDLPPLMEMTESTYLSNSMEELTPSEGNSSYYETVWNEDQSLLNLLLQNKCAEGEFLPVIGEEEANLCAAGAGFRPCYDHELLTTTTNSGGFDCSWNYSFLLE